MLVALIWSGAFVPRLSISEIDESIDPSTGTYSLDFQIRNDGPLPVTLDAIAVEDVAVNGYSFDSGWSGSTGPEFLELRVVSLDAPGRLRRHR